MFEKTRKAIALGMTTLLAVQAAPELVVNAATTGWEIVVREQTPLDKVYFDTEDLKSGEKYLVGYNDDKVAISDMSGKIVAKTDYTGIAVQNAILNGKTVYAVEKDGLVGLADLKGKEVLPCTYKEISILSNYEGHSLISYTKTDDTSFIKIDDKYVVKGVTNGYFRMYKNELVIVSYREVQGEWLYDLYDLTGEKKVTLTWEQLCKEDSDENTTDSDQKVIDSYCDAKAGKEAYETAKKEWLLAKEDALISGAEAYFAETNMNFSKSGDSFTGYQCRNGNMYYYIVTEGEVSKTDTSTVEDGWSFPFYIYYIQIYDAEKQLISEGQTNLFYDMVAYGDIQGAIPHFVYVLDKEGNLLKFAPEKGSMESLFAWKKGAVLLREAQYVSNMAKQNNIPLYVCREEYTTTTQSHAEPEIYVTYRSRAFIDVTDKKNVYLPADKSVASYDSYMPHMGLFLKAGTDEQTEFYCAKEKFEKLTTFDEPIGAFSLEGSWSYAYVAANNTYCIVNRKKGKIYLLGKDFGVIENGKENLATNVSGVRYYENGDKSAFLLCTKEKYDEDGEPIASDGQVKGSIVFVDPKLKTVSWKEVSSEAQKAFTEYYHSVNNEKFQYTIAGQSIYYIDFTKEEYKELDLTNAISDQTGAVEAVTELNGELYIQYSVSDGGTKYYGYIDLDGTILCDAKAVKLTSSYGDIKKIGRYIICGRMLLDQNGNKLSENVSYTFLYIYDESEKGNWETDFYLFYSDADGEEMGFVYDAKKDKVLYDFKDTGKKYRSGTVFGDYIVLRERNNSVLTNSVCINTTTGKVEKKLTGYFEVIDSKNKCYYAFMLDGEKSVVQLPDTTEEEKVQKGKSYKVGKQTYKVTSTTAKTVTFVKTTNKGTTDTIPATVKIKGTSFKVTAIADNAYKDNKKLKKVVVGSNVKTIGKNVWKNCKNLTTIQLKTKALTKVGSSAVKGTNKKLKITVPSGKKKAYQKLWKGKGNSSAKIG